MCSPSSGTAVDDSKPRAFVGAASAERPCPLPCEVWGLGTEAVQALVSLLLRHTPVATIVAATDARNLPCLRMLDKAGLRMTGERMAVFKGEACMEHVFAIERDGRR